MQATTSRHRSRISVPQASESPSPAAPPPGKPIVVIGSINMDLVCRAAHIPRPGETILGSEFVTIPGGKGANQAVAAAKLAAGARPASEQSSTKRSTRTAEAAGASSSRAPGGHEVYMIGRLGDDDFGARLINGLDQHGVRTDYVTITEGAPSGCAMILVDQAGENSIVVVPGANAFVSESDVDAAESLIRGAACVVLQLEIPLATVGHAIAMCQRHGVRTILDPAPVPPQGIPPALYAVDIFTPNQSEAELLVGLEQTHHVKTQKILDPKQVGIHLLSRGAKEVVLKLGAAGALIIGREGRIDPVKPFKVEVVDTTAAGDAFTGALAVALAEGADLPAAVRFANAAGAICCKTFGAQPALPTRHAVDALLAKTSAGN